MITHQPVRETAAAGENARAHTLPMKKAGKTRTGSARRGSAAATEAQAPSRRRGTEAAGGEAGWQAGRRLQANERDEPKTDYSKQ